MINNVIKFLSKMFVALCVLGVFLSPSMGADNLPSVGDIGDWGTLSTEHNQQAFISSIGSDISEFSASFENKLVSDFVPPEVYVGMALMNGLSIVGHVLDTSLVRFVVIFIVIMFVFWLIGETYQMMTKGGENIQKFFEDAVKKAIVITMWIIVLQFGLGRVFMWIVGPIINIGTYLSDFILNSVVTIAGVSLPDTCGAIHQYVASHASDALVMDSATAADIMCVPTRMSGLFYTAVAAGFKWMFAGIGTSAFTFLIGAVFVVMFIWLIWKFMVMAFGVIVDLFLAVLLLPFTAIAETVSKTSYKGIAGEMLNKFTDIFKPQNLESQILRFINAAVYFVALSVIIALCYAMFSTVVTPNMAKGVPTAQNNDFMVVLLTGTLVAYIASRGGQIATSIGGKIETDTGKAMVDDVKNLGRRAYSEAKGWYKAYKDSKKP